MMNALFLEAYSQNLKDFEQCMADLKQVKENSEKAMKILDELRSKSSPECGNALLSVKQVLRELDLKRDDKAWREIRPILIENYGMQRIGKSGLRIPRKKLNDFIVERFK